MTTNNIGYQMECIPASKRQRTGTFDVNNIHQTCNIKPFNYPHRRYTSSSSDSHSHSHSHSHSRTNPSNCLSILQLNSNNNNNNKDQLLDEQSLTKLKQTSNKMAQITDKYHINSNNNNSNNNKQCKHLSRTHNHDKQWNNDHDGQYVAVRSSYNINIDNNHLSLHRISNNNHPKYPSSMSMMASMSMSNTYQTNCNPAIKSNSRRKFRSFTHTIDQEQEFASNNVELDDDIDINMSMAASLINTDRETRNYNTSVSNTLSPLSCLHVPLASHSPLALDSLDHFNLNTNANAMSTTSINRHSTISAHIINEYAEDGNEDKDICDKNRCSVLDVLNDLKDISL